MAGSLAGRMARGLAYRVTKQLTTARLAVQLRRDARQVRAAVRADGGRGLFIDCGSNLGQGFRHFRGHFPPDAFDYVLVEPNPFCVERLRHLSAELGGAIELIPAAASTAEGEARFYGLTEDARGGYSEGGSIVRDHATAWYAPDASRATVVPTFSFADLLERMRGRYRGIAIKMDIEGAECEVLEDVIARGLHRAIAVLYVEFHSQYMTEPSRSVYAGREAAIARAFAAAGVPLRRWI